MLALTGLRVSWGTPFGATRTWQRRVRRCRAWAGDARFERD
jgi:hypothetical protein